MHTKGKVEQKMMHQSFRLYQGNYDICEIRRSTRFDKPNADRIASLWNAADGMTTEEAVRYLEHGREMVDLLYRFLGCSDIHGPVKDLHDSPVEDALPLLAKLEG